MNETFWSEHKGFLALDTTGNVFFTKKGKMRYLPLFRSIGLTIEEVKTLEQFQAALTALQEQENKLYTQNIKLKLNSADTPEKEKIILRRILGIPPSEVSATVLNFKIETASNNRQKYSHHG